MNKADKYQTVSKSLMKLVGFVEKFLPIANTHNCDFITESLWENFIPANIADELLSLTEENLSLLPLGKLCIDEDNDEPFSELNDTYINDTEKGISHCFLKNNENSNADSNVKRTKSKWDKSLKPVWDGKGLKEFVKEVNLHRLASFQITESRESVLKLFQMDITTPYHISHGMNAKKSHEIEMMTHLCAVFAKFHNIDVVVDIGSGKGYLGCQLAMTHQFQVLGIDSSNINTTSAKIRTHRVQKQWNGLVRNAAESKTNKQSEQQEENPQKLHKRTDLLRKVSNSVDNGSVCVSASQSVQTNNSIKPTSDIDTLTEKQFLLNGVKEHSSISTESHIGLDVNTEAKNINLVQKIQQNSSGYNELNTGELYIPVTEYVTSDTDLLKLMQSNFYSKIDITENKYSECCKKQQEESIAGIKINNCKISRSILLTGLHTCGDLASNVLKLFISNKDVTAMCHVGCCYHLIEEEFLLSPYSSTEDASSAVEAGFPLSQVLRKKQFMLGRNARMLACQAPDRLVEQAKLPDRSLYWRALLQVILRDITGTIRDDWHVGRIAAKCSDFKQYVRKALSKLDINKQLSNEEIEEHETKYEHYHQKLNAFFQLKALLAPCIEAIILLDRLLFLLEEKCTENAQLVQVFDTVISPRCYALIASKKKGE